VNLNVSIFYGLKSGRSIEYYSNFSKENTTQKVEESKELIFINELRKYYPSQKDSSFSFSLNSSKLIPHFNFINLCFYYITEGYPFDQAVREIQKER